MTLRASSLPNLPKVELHVHFDGALSNELLFEHMKTFGISDSMPDTTVLPWEPEAPLKVTELLEGCATLGDFNCLCQCQGQRSLNTMLKCF